MTIVAAIILAVLAPFILFDAVFRPTIRRLAIRNIVRRPAEAVLVVVGSLLATALITGSFIIGDSFGASIRGIAIDRWGPTDEIVILAGADDIGPAITAIEAAGRGPAPVVERDAVTTADATATSATTDEPLFDGLLGVTYLDLAVGSSGDDPVVEPEVRFLEADPSAATTYAGTTDAVAGLTELAADQVVVNQTVADDLGVATGDELIVYLEGRPVAFEVAGVAPASGLNGFAPIVAAPGAVTGLLPQPDAVTRNAVLVSNVGDTFTGAELTDDAVAALTEAVGEGVDVFPAKQDLLDDADEVAADQTELFGTIGGFSVAAGILLVVNLFVMLAGERKSELGTLRAVGLRRGHLIRSFALEGAVYGVLAAGVGVVVGIGLAAAVMTLAGDLIDATITMRLDVVPTSLVSGAVIGLMVSQVTVLLTSWRMTHLNIVRAIKELPAPRRSGHRWRGLVAGSVGVIAAGAVLATAGDTPAVAMAAPVLAAVAAIPLLSRLVPPRVAVVVACGAGLAWAGMVFALMPDTMAEPEIFLFLIQGILLVGLATVIVAALDRVWLGAAASVSRGDLATRLGLAEPLARPTRSALLVAMYALVIFTITFMLVMNAVFQAQTPLFARQAGGDYDIYLDLNDASGLTAAELEADGSIAHAAGVRQGSVALRPVADDEASDTGDEFVALVGGIDADYLEAGPPALTDRLDAFATDGDVWAAVADGEALLIIDEDWGFAVGDRIGLAAPGDPDSMIVTVAGTTEQAWMTDSEVVVGGAVLAGLVDPDTPVSRYYLDLVPGADAEAVADRLTADRVADGVDARTFLSAAEAATDEQEGFLNLLQVYMGLGLLIGIAGLGVVLIRAVRERRRQFGVLRALGISSAVIRRAFVIEASFVALQGLVLGVALGILSSWQTLTRSSAIEADLTFRLPVQGLAIVAAGCLAASLVMAAVPAVRAGRVVPAEALRLT